MPIAREVIEEIRSRVSIYDVVSQSVRLQSAGGGRFKGLCPFHKESTPSFTINTAQNMFYCFGCTLGGDVFKFIMHQRGLSFQEAVQDLADYCGIMIQKVDATERRKMTKRQKLYKICQAACDHFVSNLWIGNKGRVAREYILDRNFSEDTVRHFQVGFAQDSFDALINHLKAEGFDHDLIVAAGLARYRDPQRPFQGCYSLFRNRLIIPIRDPRGRVIAFGARTLTGDMPKYINSPETDIYKKSQTLYALSLARSSIQSNSNAILVEGYFDAMALHQAGFKQAIATCGTALTADHLRILRPMTTRIFTVFDADQAGQKAIEKSYPLMVEARIVSEQVQLGEAKDPDEFIQKYGAEAFGDALKNAEPTLVLKIQLLSEKFGLSPMGKTQIIEELVPLLKKMKDVTREACIAIIASRLGVSENGIRSYFRQGVQKPIEPSKPRVQKSIHVLLRDLLWLCIHQIDIIRPYLVEIKPDEISENQELVYIVARFLQGDGVHEIISSLEEQDTLRRLLMELLMEEQLYNEKQALPAAEQIVLRMKLQKLERDFLEKQQVLSELSINHDVHQHLSLLQELQTLRKDIETQRNLISKNESEASKK